MSRRSLQALLSTARRCWRRWGFCAALGGLAGVLLIAVAFWASVRWWPYPAGVEQMPCASTRIEDRNGQPLGAFASPEGQWQIPLKPAEIGDHLRNAVVAVEDCRFHEHSGVDWKSVAGAVWENALSLRSRRGASTLTMQLHRLRSGVPRSFWGKWQQAVRATQLERQLSKDQILAEYLNRAPFGGNLAGAGAASWRYFGKPCQMLSLGEAALLAGLPQSPNRLRPDRYPERARARRNHVLNRMLACGMITPAQHTEATDEPITARWLPLPQATTPVQQANGLAPTLRSLAGQRPGARVRTTIDASLQQQTASAALEALAGLTRSGVDSLAVVVLDTASGECRARVSLSYREADLDLTERPRSTGSVLKPFIYAAAFENHIVEPEDLLDDSPKAWPGYRPDNFDHNWRGTMRAADALAESRNIPALALLSRLGVDYTVGTLEAAGFKTLAEPSRKYGLSLAIGGAEATPLEVAQAYATLARGGRFIPATTFQGPPEEARPCLANWACGQALAACSGEARTAAISPEAAKLHVAWKTGTSSGHRDAWCAAVTSTHTVVVWLGNARGGGAEALVGTEAAAPLALRVIASLGGPAQRWPTLAPGHGPTRMVKPAAPIRRQAIALVSPVSGTEIIREPSASGRQQIPLEAKLTQPAKGEEAHLWWFVNGQLLGKAENSQQLWWEPTPGLHEITVSTQAGHSASARIRVR